MLETQRLLLRIGLKTTRTVYLNMQKTRRLVRLQDGCRTNQKKKVLM